MGAHWFDRLARSRAASTQAGFGGSAELTRRDALARAGAATLSLGALGAFGALPATAATPRPASLALAGQPAACRECNNEANKFRNREAQRNDRAFLHRYAPTPAAAFGAFFWALNSIANEVGRSGELRECAAGVCNPQAMSPAPSVNPATDVETGAPSCPPGTRDCGEAPGTGSHYCCFGTDVCCNGTCCIADVGCACAPG